MAHNPAPSQAAQAATARAPAMNRAASSVQMDANANDPAAGGDGLAGASASSDPQADPFAAAADEQVAAVAEEASAEADKKAADAGIASAVAAAAAAAEDATRASGAWSEMARQK